MTEPVYRRRHFLGWYSNIRRDRSNTDYTLTRVLLYSSRNISLRKERFPKSYDE